MGLNNWSMRQGNQLCHYALHFTGCLGRCCESESHAVPSVETNRFCRPTCCKEQLVAQQKSWTLSLFVARSLVHFGGDGLVDEEFASPKISVTRLEKLETGSEPPFQSRKRSVPFPILSTEKLFEVCEEPQSWSGLDPGRVLLKSTELSRKPGDSHSFIAKRCKF